MMKNLGRGGLPSPPAVTRKLDNTYEKTIVDTRQKQNKTKQHSNAILKENNVNPGCKPNHYPDLHKVKKMLSLTNKS